MYTGATRTGLHQEVAGKALARGWENNSSQSLQYEDILEEKAQDEIKRFEDGPDSHQKCRTSELDDAQDDSGEKYPNGVQYAMKQIGLIF